MVRGRFAPSPSGRIHLGNILCCLLAWLSARQRGGGVVLRPENIQALRQNSLLIWLDRPLEQLAVGKGRPLSPNPEANRLLYQQRAPLYQQYADYRQACAQTPAETVELLVEYWQTI